MTGLSQPLETVTHNTTSPRTGASLHGLPEPTTPQALILAREARRTPARKRSPRQQAIAAVYRRDGDTLHEMTRWGPDWQEAVAWAILVNAHQGLASDLAQAGVKNGSPAPSRGGRVLNPAPARTGVASADVTSAPVPARQRVHVGNRVALREVAR